MTNPETPRVEATPTASGEQFTITCPYCGRTHTHGAGYGHRVAHCGDPHVDGRAATSEERRRARLERSAGYVLVPPKAEPLAYVSLETVKMRSPRPGDGITSAVDAVFTAGVAALRCGHDHVPAYHNGFAHYAGPWCPAYARLVAEQRGRRRDPAEAALGIVDYRDVDVTPTIEEAFIGRMATSDRALGYGLAALTGEEFSWWELGALFSRLRYYEEDEQAAPTFERVSAHLRGSGHGTLIMMLEDCVEAARYYGVRDRDVAYRMLWDADYIKRAGGAS